jgi:hypothetical protein
MADAMMRQRKPLQRTGEIARTSPLRRTPLDRGTPRLRSSGPIKAKRPRQGAEEKEAKRLTRARSGGWCEQRVPGVCRGRAREFSHRWAEGQGGLWCASNGMDSCGLAGCHGWLHSHPVEAKRLGWVIAPTYRIEDARRVPVPPSEFGVVIWLPGWHEPREVWLTDDGQYLDTPPAPLSDYQQKGA